MIQVDRLAIAERLLRWSLGVVYLWFGALKLVGMSPALELVRLAYEPLATLPLYLGLALLELGLGVSFLLGFFPRLTAAAAILHLLGTFSLLLSSPRTAFLPRFPFLTIEGEFVVKNLVLLAAAASLWLASPRPPAAHRPRVRLAALTSLLAVAGLLGFAGSGLHASLRSAAWRSSQGPARPLVLTADAVQALVGEGPRLVIAIEGTIADRCRLLGCWLMVQDRTGQVFVDLAAAGLSARGLALGSRVRVAGHIGKTREGRVGFVATAFEASQGMP